MGNSSNRDKDLLIYIETQKEFYNSGSNIQGVVFIEAKKNFAFDALYIRVEGDEWCQWLEGSSKNRQKFTGSQNFYSVEHVIEKYPGGSLQTGCYAYPFSFELSENIPGSFCSNDHQAKIQYRLAAYFVNYQQPNNKEIEYIPLQIREPFRQQMVSYEGTSTQEPKSCGCFSKGKVTLSASFDKNVCCQKESIKLRIRVNNREGSENISKIRIELVQNIFVCSNSGTNRTYRNVCQSKDVPMQVAKGQEKAEEHTFEIGHIQNQTAIGTLVGNHYRLEVSTQAGLISSNNPCIYSPLFILKEQFNNLRSITKPRQLPSDIKRYNTHRLQHFRAPEYWFKKNINLSVMNFRLEDGQADIQQ